MNPNFNQKPELNRVASREAMFADKLRLDVEAGKIDVASLNNDQSIEEAVLKKFKRDPRFSGISITDIIKEFKKSGLIKPMVVEKIKEPKKEPEREYIGIKIPESNLVEVEDEELKKRAKINIDKEEAKKQKEFILQNREVIESLLEKARKILNSGLDPTEYVKAGVISEKEVMEDMQKVAQREDVFGKKMTLDEKEIKKNSTIFEAIVVDGVNLSECFGENVKASPTNPHDDYFRNTDVYLNCKNNKDEKDIALGLDVKMGSIEGHNFTKKVEGILSDIKTNNRKKIKYFKNFNGELKKNIFIPKVVISCEFSMIKELMFDFNNLDKDKFSEKLKSHRMSREMVSQVVGECKLFARYAEENGQDEIAGYYHNFFETIYSISEESPILKRLLVGAGSDFVSIKIKEIIDEFKYAITKTPAGDLEEIGITV